MAEYDGPGAYENARDRMVKVLAEALWRPPEEYTGGNLPQALAEHTVDWLVGQPGGWLIYAGAVRDVRIADRFGPSSWEITTDEHPQDRQTWETPDGRV